jgi:phage head maturation protease
MRKRLVESPIGIKTTEETARKLDLLLKELPKDSAYSYRRKSSSTVIDTAAPERVDVSRVTTREMDRDNEIVLPEGIELEDYQRNPIVLFGHNQDRPVGKALWIKADADGVVAKTQYTSRPDGYDGEWLPDFVWSMVQADVLRGKSIGFLPLEIRDPEPDELEANPGLDAVISRALLLEYSVVSVPSNPGALVAAIGKGQPLGPWTYKVLGRVKKPAPPKRTRPDGSKLAGEVADIRLDPNRIAESALAGLLKKWEV